jgi:acid phosphatase
MVKFNSLGLSGLLVLSLAACAISPQQPDNVGELKTDIIAYHQSGNYAREIAAVDAEAEAYILEHANDVAKPALVLDIDETSLSNWPALRANDFGYLPDAPCKNLPNGPCGMKAWQKLAKADAIAPTLHLFNVAKANGVTVFFITGRDERGRASTQKNLHRAGYNGWKALFMRPAGTTTPSAADYKAPARIRIEDEGYAIIASVGDQPSDLAGGHAKRVFLLPDPFYRIP